MRRLLTGLLALFLITPSLVSTAAQAEESPHFLVAPGASGAASHVINGTVLSTQNVVVSGSPYQVSKLRVDRVLQGTALPGEILVQVDGGTLPNGLMVSVSGVPVLRPDTAVQLALTAAPGAATIGTRVGSPGLPVFQIPAGVDGAAALNGVAVDGTGGADDRPRVDGQLVDSVTSPLSQPPNVQFDSPTSLVAGTHSLSGTVSAAGRSPVSSVFVSVRHAESGKYWNGSSWAATPYRDLAVLDGQIWTVRNVDFSDSGKYHVLIWAYDKANSEAGWWSNPKPVIDVTPAAAVPEPTPEPSEEQEEEPAASETGAGAGTSTTASSTAAECSSARGLPYRGDILPYLRGSSDATVPPGRYSVGGSSAQGEYHRVDEARDSWITVKAEVPGTVVVDGSINQGGLIFTGDGLGGSRKQKLVVAGIHFVAMSVRFESTQDVSFWYTCHEYTPRQWHVNAMAAAEAAGVEVPATGPKDPHGDGGGIYSFNPNGSEWARIADRMGSFSPTGIRATTGSAGASKNLRFFGVDIGPVANDGIFMVGTWDAVVQGVRISSVSELYEQADGDAISVDPGPVFGTQQDQFHNDGIQFGGAGYRPLLLDSWSAGRIMWNKIPSPAREGWDMQVRRTWFGASPSINTGGADQVKARSDDPRFSEWAIGNAGGPWPAEPIAFIGAVSSTPEQMSGEFSDITYISYDESPFTFKAAGVSRASAADFPNLELTNITTRTFGLGYRDIFTDVDTIARHPENPANVWRAAHPYSELASFAGLTSRTYEDSGPIDGGGGGTGGGGGGTGGGNDDLVGDVNCNGELDIRDALAIAQYVAGSRTDSRGCPLSDQASELNLSASDVSADGTVTISDAALVLQCIAEGSTTACFSD